MKNIFIISKKKLINSWLSSIVINFRHYQSFYTDRIPFLKKIGIYVLNQLIKYKFDLYTVSIQGVAKLYSGLCSFGLSKLKSKTGYRTQASLHVDTTVINIGILAYVICPIFDFNLLKNC